jgi:hypothetical protein
MEFAKIPLFNYDIKIRSLFLYIDKYICKT